MGFTDKLKETAQKSKDAAQKGLGDAREKASEMTLKRRFNGLAEELGTLEFRRRRGESALEAEIERVVGEMGDIASQLDALDD
jgi:DNA anti-recombination protein RmuC